MSNGAARMTNGVSGGVAGGTMTVQYDGGAQTITVPVDVSVTEIVATSTKLTTGASVTIPATKRRRHAGDVEGDARGWRLFQVIQ